MGAEVFTISSISNPSDAAVDLFRAVANIGPVFLALILSHGESVPSSSAEHWRGYRIGMVKVVASRAGMVFVS